jgi:phage tail sheath protein FI
VPTYRAPGIYVEEISSGSHPIPSVATSTAAFLGAARKGPINKPTLVTSFSEFERKFGGPYAIIRGAQEHYLYYAVRHFFQQGGSRCYVVRVAHYQDGVLQAVPSSTTFDGMLTVSAISPGTWGRELEVQVVNSTAFSLPLKEDVAQGASQIVLPLNDQVRVGSLLWIVEEVTGRIEKIERGVTFVPYDDNNPGGGLRRVDNTTYSGTISSNTPVYGPRLTYLGATGSEVHVDGGVPDAPDGIGVAPLKKTDGADLRPGDTLAFAITQALGVVDRVSAQPDTTLVHFANATLPIFKASRSRVYARGFTLNVRRRVGKDILEIVEVHENLSLVKSNRVDDVGVRLGADSGASQYIAASDGPASDVVVLNNSDFKALEGGSDGLNNDPNNPNVTTLPADDFKGDELLKTGLHALTPITDVAILVVPNACEDVAKGAIAYCDRRGDLFLILERWSGSRSIEEYRDKVSSKYAALYDPWISVTDVATGKPALVPPSGALAGIYALTDSRRGVHKAPAGLDVGKVVVADGLERIFSKAEYDGLYPKNINAILKSSDGIHVWGSRTLSPDSEWQQINVRRLFNFLEKSIENGTQWVAFEPNDPTLWKNIERNVSAFLRIQWLEGKLVGATEKEAFFVHCNAETNPPEVVNAGQVITVIGVAPSRPAEFVIFRIKQKVGPSVG